MVMQLVWRQQGAGTSMSDEIDLEALDAYLSSDDSPDDCMMLSDLEGFLHRVVCSPDRQTSSPQSLPNGYYGA